MNTYTTDDLAISSWLLTRGHKFTGLQRVSERKLLFVFDDNRGEIEESVNAFLSGAECSGRRLLDSERWLKSVIFTEQNK